jgi:uncharacterized protein
MALTNYLMHSIVFGVLFYSHGLGWHGRFHYAGLLGMAAVMWVFQLVASPLWLKVFRYGPLEWVWRCVTYWRIVPLMRAPGAG